MTDPLAFSRDPIFDDRTIISQRIGGYRFSVDALLLSWFVADRLPRGGGGNGIEFGAGSGVISILLKRRGLPGPILCVERQPGLFDLLKTNIAANDLAEELTPLRGDLREISLPREHFSPIFFNPPYHPATAGRTSPDDERAAARHELHGSLDDFLRVGAGSLRKRGHLFFIYPVERGPYACALLAAHGLRPVETCAVRQHEDSPPTLFLFHCVRGPIDAGKQRFTILSLKERNGEDTAVGVRIQRATACRNEKRTR
jgi:tRNA1Val (adenine37-N6)-methyltransferase